MHTLEPFYNWRDRYISEDDEGSPFFEREYDEFQYSTKIYNYYIHPQWDGFGSSTLYMKVLFADYAAGFAILEFIGEWNDAINNDIMFLKRDVMDQFIGNGINKFILVGENVLNAHADGDDYYEEWYEDVIEEGGWVTAVNFREHVLEEWRQAGLHRYIHFGAAYNHLEWRKLKPKQFMQVIDGMLIKMIS